MKETIVKKLSIVGIGGNILLSALKFLCGIIGSSTALIADALHSLSDVVATFIAFIGCKIADKPADSSHPYGHEKFESLATLFLVIILATVPTVVIYEAISSLISGSYEMSEPPNVIALIAAIISIAIKEAMFHYTRRNARKINSSAFEADAWHHRSDAISSVGALIGIGVAMAGFPIGEPLATLFIGAILVKVVIDLAKSAIAELTDAAIDKSTCSQIEECILSIDGITSLDKLQTRKFGSKIYVDAEIGVDGNLPLHKAHDICHRAHDCVESKIDTVKHIMIHVNPT